MLAARGGQPEHHRLRSVALTQPTSLDVTGYARLWRLAWWTQNFEFPLALLMAGICLFASGEYAIGRLDTFEANLNAYIASQPVSEPERQQTAALAAAAFRLIRDGVGAGLVDVAAITIAAAYLIAAYLLACGRFRLRLLTWTLLAWTVLAFVALRGLMHASELGAFSEMVGRQASATFHAQLLLLLSAVMFLIAIVLLAIRGVLVLLLWVHRLRPDLPRTHRMTRSLRMQLAMPRFSLAHVSPAGVAVHLATLLLLGALIYLFPMWILIALIFSLTDMFFLLFQTPVQLYHLLVRLVTGAPLGLDAELAIFLKNIDDVIKLLVIMAVLSLVAVIWRFGRRLNLRRRNEILRKDKPPVLLLRSFADDSAGIPSNMMLTQLFWRRKRLEEMIGEELIEAGPFVAIGKPGETLPQIGASRLYLGDSEWQQVVQSYIAQSEPIIMIAGKTHWVQWELSNIIKADRIAKLLLVFPRITEADRAERWRNLSQSFTGTPWAGAAAAFDLTHVLAVHASGPAGLAAIKSRRTTESDYEAALRLATFLMRRRPAST